MDILSKLQAPEGAVTKPTRIGRGVGSGIGKTSGRGQKGQKARAGGNINKRHFQGGQTPLQRRVPKRGFRNPLAPIVVNVNVSTLELAFEAGANVTIEALVDKRLIQGRFDKVKILGDGELTKKLTVTAHRFSETASKKIAAAGGSAVLIPKPVKEKPEKKAKPTAKSKAKKA